MAMGHPLPLDKGFRNPYDPAILATGVAERKIMRTRNNRIQVRLNDKEYKRYLKLLDKSSLKSEQFLRKLINNTKIKESPTEDIQRIKYLLSNISNNINQIAKHANTTGMTDSISLDAAVILIRKCYKEIEEL
jgi:hypothetical protein